MPAGFNYYPEFISAAEEKDLVEMISGLKLTPLVFQGFTAKRKVESFGYSYHFDDRSITRGAAIPGQLGSTIEKIALLTSLPSAAIAQVLISEYPAGSVINWHRDAPPFDTIFGLSLQSDCIFRFRPHDKSKRRRGAIISMTVENRSLYIIRDEARTDWEHSILPVVKPRYSITFRTLRPGYGQDTPETKQIP